MISFHAIYPFDGERMDTYLMILPGLKSKFSLTILSNSTEVLEELP